MYIPHAEMSSLQPEVRYHEPWLALEGGWANGLEYFDLICKGAAQHLLPGGYLLLETSGGGQVKDVLKLIASLKNYNLPERERNTDIRARSSSRRLQRGRKIRFRLETK